MTLKFHLWLDMGNNCVILSPSPSTSCHFTTSWPIAWMQLTYKSQFLQCFHEHLPTPLAILHKSLKFAADIQKAMNH